MKVVKIGDKEVGVSAGTLIPHYTRGEKDWRIDVEVTPVDEDGKLVYAQTNRVSTYHPRYVAKEGENMGRERGAPSKREEHMAALPDKAIDQALAELGYTSKLKPEKPAKK